MRLLVSVLGPDEAPIALAGGADIVDVKDPAEGALGAAGPATLRAVRAVVTPPAQLSAALGDAPVAPGTLALAAHGAAACGVDYVKIGLLGPLGPGDVLRLLRAVQAGVTEANPATRVVVVAYADAARVGAFPPLRLPPLAREVGIHGVMLDTWVKDGTTSIGALGESGVAAFLSSARSGGLLAALAGSLRLEDVARAEALGAELVGVRGSACEGGRLGRVSAERVRALHAALAGSRIPA